MRRLLLIIYTNVRILYCIGARRRTFLARNGRRARVVKGMDSKPIVISRAGSSPAVDETFLFCESVYFIKKIEKTSAVSTTD